MVERIKIVARPCQAHAFASLLLSLMLLALAVPGQAIGETVTGLSRPFEGTFKDETTTLTLKADALIPGEAYSGTLERGASSFPLHATAANGKLTGMFKTPDGDEFPFTAEIDAGNVKFATGRTVLILKSPPKPKANPFDMAPGAAAAPKPVNPLDDPGAPAVKLAPARPPLSKGATIAEIQAAAEGGDPAAMNRMGVINGNGEGVPQDFSKAVAWYKKAADAGNLSAMTNLGIMYEQGHGIAADPEKAMALYHAADAAGNTVARVRLGIMYFNGVGMKPDAAEAVKWYRKAADDGDAEGMNYLAICYLNGNGVPEDATQCVAWLEKAADRNYALSILNLGKLYALGRGVAKSPTKAMEWFVKGAHLADPESARQIAMLYESGAGMDKPDDAKALAWYQAAAQMGDEPSRKWLAENGPGAAPPQVRERGRQMGGRRGHGGVEVRTGVRRKRGRQRQGRERELDQWALLHLCEQHPEV